MYMTHDRDSIKAGVLLQKKTQQQLVIWLH